MDLWIRSQDKMNLESVHSINVNYLNKKQIICNYEPDFIGNQGEYYVLLGEYETEQRALEVLDEIQSFLENNYISIDEMPSHSNSPYPGYYPTHISTMYRKKVFKMPKE